MWVFLRLERWSFVVAVDSCLSLCSVLSTWLFFGVLNIFLADCVKMWYALICLKPCMDFENSLSLALLLSYSLSLSSHSMHIFSWMVHANTHYSLVLTFRPLEEPFSLLLRNIFKCTNSRILVSFMLFTSFDRVFGSFSCSKRLLSDCAEEFGEVNCLIPNNHTEERLQ